jgi:hypothetical protein
MIPKQENQNFKAVFGIEKWAGFAMHLLTELDNRQTETVSCGSKQGRQHRAMACYEGEGFWGDEKY